MPDKKGTEMPRSVVDLIKKRGEKDDWLSLRANHSAYWEGAIVCWTLAAEYFRAHPEALGLMPIPQDKSDPRNSVAAFLAPCCVPPSTVKPAEGGKE